MDQRGRRASAYQPIGAGTGEQCGKRRRKAAQQEPPWIDAVGASRGGGEAVALTVRWRAAAAHARGQGGGRLQRARVERQWR